MNDDLRLELTVCRTTFFVWGNFYIFRLFEFSRVQIPFSLGWYFRHFSASLQKTEELFFARKPIGWFHFSGTFKRVHCGIEFRAVVLCPLEFSSVDAREFTVSLEQKLGTGWKVQSLVQVYGDSRHQIALETV